MRQAGQAPRHFLARVLNLERSGGSPELSALLKRYWGYDSFRPLQLQAMEAVLAGRDSLVVMPTGGGKSLCFQAPALAMRGLAIVISPLISLMKDQVDALVANGIAAARLDSSLDWDEQKIVLRGIARGETRILYISPERMLSDRFRQYAKTLDISLIAIDEAHCVSIWGHDFRPEYRLIGALRDDFPGVALHAYTATATRQVRDDIVLQLGLKNPDLLVGSFDRPNLFYRAERRVALAEQIAAIIDRHKGESGIIYCIRRKDVDAMCATLRARGVRALPYHAGLSDRERKEHQDAFIEDRVEVIVATVAFGMGIDKSNVRYVIHAGMPKSLEHYQQESGRAGRDGLPAECCIFHSPADLQVWRFMTREMEGEQAVIAAEKLQAMHRYCAGGLCRHRAILNYFEQHHDGARCGACDICAGDIATLPDALIVAQKAISCVARLDQRFGADYVAKVLAGSSESRIADSGHDRLSTWGILKEHGAGAVRDWIEQLVAQGFLAREGEYRTLVITGAGKAALRGETVPLLTAPPADAGRARRRTRGTARTAAPAGVAAPEGAAAPAGTVGAAGEPEADARLFDDLRALRQEYAKAKKVPAYIIFSDVTLRDLAARRPTVHSNFLEIRGVGAKKAREYAVPFIDLIAARCLQYGLPTDRGF